MVYVQLQLEKASAFHVEGGKSSSSSQSAEVVEFTAQTAFAAQEEISVCNSGSVCVDWFLSRCADEISDSEISAFLVGRTQGKLLPQAKTAISVFFLPRRQGVFTQRWQLRTVPPSAAGETLVLTLVGVASHEEPDVDRKKLELKKSIKHRQISVQTSELVEDLLGTVKTPPSTPPGDFDEFWLKFNNRQISETIPDVVAAFKTFNNKVNDWRVRLDARYTPQPPYALDAIASAILSVKTSDAAVDKERRELLRELKALQSRLNKKRSSDCEIIFTQCLAPVLGSLATVRAAVLQTRFGQNVPLDGPKEIFEKFVGDAIKKQKGAKLPETLEQCRTEISEKLAKDILDAASKAAEISDQARRMLGLHERMELGTSVSRIRNRPQFPGDEPLANQVVAYELPEGSGAEISSGSVAAVLAEILDKAPNALILLPPPSLAPKDETLDAETAATLLAQLEKLLEGEAVTGISDPGSFDRAEFSGEIGKRVFLATARVAECALLANIAIVENFTRRDLNSVRSVVVGPEINAEITKLAGALEVSFEAPDSVAPRRNSFATAVSGNFLIFDGFHGNSVKTLNTLRNLVPSVTSIAYLGGPLGLATVRTVVQPKTDIAAASVLVDLLGEFADIYVPTNFRLGEEELLTLETAVNAEKITSEIFPGVWVVLDAMAGKLELVSGEAQKSEISGSRLDEPLQIAGAQEGARVKELTNSARKIIWLGSQDDEKFNTEIANGLSRRLKPADGAVDDAENGGGEELDENENDFLEPGTAPRGQSVFENFGAVPIEACAVIGAGKRAVMESAFKDGFGLVYVSKHHKLIEAAIAGQNVAALDDVWN